MKFVLFYHSVLSCWNHGNVHFLRGICRELIRLGHEVIVYEPEDGWSRVNALAEGGAIVLAEAQDLVPGLKIETYLADKLDFDRALDGADVVIAHEWNSTALIASLGHRRMSGASFTLLFHDTHHRAVTAEEEMSRIDLDGYDAVLAFGDVLRDIYRRRGWGKRAFTWHEAADTALFYPATAERKNCDLIWVGNWGDNERTRELKQFLFKPVRRLAIRARIHGVRYPQDALEQLTAANIRYGGWLPNHRVPATFARSNLTVHIPRKPYAQALAGIPTIRIFEALACGIPLISAPWSDVEGLFPPGAYLTARSADEMTAAIALVLLDRDLAGDLARTGLRTIREHHSCAHRVRELTAIVDSLARVPHRAATPALQREASVP